MRCSLPAVALCAAVTGWSSCASPGDLFECTDDAQCTGTRGEGVCEANGFCSLVDATCASGRRFASAAPPEFRDACVIDLAVAPPCASDDSYGSPFEAGGSTYRLVNTPLSWSGARATCEADGAHVLVIDDGFESAHMDILRGTNGLWIGMSDELVGDRFLSESGLAVRSNGLDLRHTEWAAGNPTGVEAADCVSINDAALGWVDGPCSAAFSFVCECPAVAPPCSAPPEVHDDAGVYQIEVPPGCQQATLLLWGGGGGGGDGQATAASNGGGGAFVQATVAVEPGGALRLVIGGGGSGGAGPIDEAPAYGGGGGGATAVFDGEGALLFIAGGGGGGSGGAGTAGKEGGGGAGVGSGPPLPGGTASDLCSPCPSGGGGFGNGEVDGGTGGRSTGNGGAAANGGGGGGGGGAPGGGGGPLNTAGAGGGSYGTLPTEAVAPGAGSAPGYIVGARGAAGGGIAGQPGADGKVVIEWR